MVHRVVEEILIGRNPHRKNARTQFHLGLHHQYNSGDLVVYDCVSAATSGVDWYR